MFLCLRKLLVSPEIDTHGNTYVLLAKKDSCENCIYLCPEDCKDAYGLSPPLASGQKSHMPTILVLMLCVLGAAFVVLCYLSILRRYRSNLSGPRRRNSALGDDTREDFIDENRGTVVDHPIWYINTVGLQQSVIDSIAVFKYRKGEGLIEGADCSVCLTEFQDDESLRLLPKCSHAFHMDCIDTWLRSHKNCPLCRAPIVCDTIPETAQANAVESVLNDSSSGEDTPPVGIDENNEVGSRRITTGVETISPLPNEESKMLEMLKIARKNRVRVLSDLAGHRVRVDEDLQPVRRSISMDASSASMIYATVAKIHPVEEEGCSNVQEVEMKKQNSEKAIIPGDCYSIIRKPGKSFSFGRSLQKMPIRMKRSFSSSAKFSLPRHSRSQELV